LFEREIVGAFCELLHSKGVGDPPSLKEVANKLFTGKAFVANHLVAIGHKLGVPPTDRQAFAKAILDGGWCEPDGGVPRSAC
jgi:hypothetical protein